MPTPALPEYFKREYRGEGHKRPSAVHRSAMENGMVKQARIQTRVLVQRPMSGYLDSLSDYNDFVTWFREDANLGATWFTFDDLVDGQNKLGRIVDGTIQDEPLNSALSKWRVSFTIEYWSA